MVIEWKENNRNMKLPNNEFRQLKYYIILVSFRNRIRYDFRSVGLFSNFKSIGSWRASDTEKNIRACNIIPVPSLDWLIDRYVCNCKLSSHVPYPKENVMNTVLFWVSHQLVTYPSSSHFREGTTVLLTHKSSCVSILFLILNFAA